MTKLFKLRLEALLSFCTTHRVRVRVNVKVRVRVRDRVRIRDKVRIRVG